MSTELLEHPQEQKTEEPPKMWHLFDMTRTDGPYSLCGLKMGGKPTVEAQNECVVCEDIYQQRFGARSS